MLLHRQIAVILLFLTAHPLRAQWPSNYRRPAVKGTITDSATGRPLARATISARQMGGFAWTDSSGRYLFFAAPVGDLDAAVHCPVSRALRGKLLLTRRFQIGPATDTTVDIVVDASRCRDVPERTRRVLLTGRYVHGFETSMLDPCQAIVEPDDGAYGSSRTVWVELPKRVQYRRGVRWPKARRDEAYPAVFVRWIGELRGPGSYGHMGGGGYEFKVQEILEARPISERDCQ